MLVLSRKLNQQIRIGEDIVVKVLRIDAEEIRLGITAPRNLSVDREEVYHSKRRRSTPPGAAVSGAAALIAGCLLFLGSLSAQGAATLVTVTGQLSSALSARITNEVLTFIPDNDGPLTEPPLLISVRPVRTTSSPPVGFFTVDLEHGVYLVRIGNNARDVLRISIPQNTETNHIEHYVSPAGSTDFTSGSTTGFSKNASDARYVKKTNDWSSSQTISNGMFNPGTGANGYVLTLIDALTGLADWRVSSGGGGSTPGGGNFMAQWNNAGILAGISNLVYFPNGRIAFTNVIGNGQVIFYGPVTMQGFAASDFTADSGVLAGILEVAGGISTYAYLRGSTLWITNNARFTGPVTNIGNVRIEGTLSLPDLASSRALVLNSQGAVDVSTVTLNELANVSGTTSPIQTQINNVAGATNGLHTRMGNVEGATNGLHSRTGTLETRAGNLEGATNSLHTRAGNVEGATNALHSRTGALETRASNLEGATNSLHTRAGNVEGATNALHGRVGNLEGATNGLHSGKQNADADLSRIAAIAASRGDILFRDANGWTNLAPGTAGQFLMTGGPGADPSYSTPSGSGDVAGPASATDNAFPRYNGTTGKLLQNGRTTEDDLGGVMINPAPGIGTNLFQVNYTNTTPVLGVTSNAQLVVFGIPGETPGGIGLAATNGVQVMWIEAMPNLGETRTNVFNPGTNAAPGQVLKVASVNANGTLVTWTNAAAGGGTLTTLKENGSAVGDPDIASLDFLGADFDLTESLDTEINVVIAGALTRDSEWDTAAKVEAIWSANIILASEIDTSSELAGILGDETGTGLAVFQTTPLLINATHNKAAVGGYASNRVATLHDSAYSGADFQGWEFFDDFNRADTTVASQLGTSPTGHAWSTNGPDSRISFITNGAWVCRITPATTTNNHITYQHVALRNRPDEIGAKITWDDVTGTATTFSGQLTIANAPTNMIAADGSLALNRVLHATLSRGALTITISTNWPSANVTIINQDISPYPVVDSTDRVPFTIDWLGNNVISVRAATFTTNIYHPDIEKIRGSFVYYQPGVESLTTNADSNVRVHSVWAGLNINIPPFDETQFSTSLNGTKSIKSGAVLHSISNNGAMLISGNLSVGGAIDVGSDITGAEGIYAETLYISSAANIANLIVTNLSRLAHFISAADASLGNSISNVTWNAGYGLLVAGASNATHKGSITYSLPTTKTNTFFVDAGALRPTHGSTANGGRTGATAWAVTNGISVWDVMQFSAASNSCAQFQVGLEQGFSGIMYFDLSLYSTGGVATSTSTSLWEVAVAPYGTNNTLGNWPYRTNLTHKFVMSNALEIVSLPIITLTNYNDRNVVDILISRLGTNTTASDSVGADLFVKGMKVSFTTTNQHGRF